MPALGPLLSAILLALPADTGGPLPQGELLLGELGCTACHPAPAAVEERLLRRRGPDLSQVGARVRPDWLRGHVLRPGALDPDTKMPALLGALPTEERERIADALQHFLAAQGGPLAAQPVDLAPEVFEQGRQLYHSIGCVACHVPDDVPVDLEVPWWEFESYEDPLPPEAFAPDEDDGETNASMPGVLPAPAVPLEGLADKYTLDTLAEFLRDPLRVRPGGRMPSLHLSPDEARAMAAWLLRGQATPRFAADELAPGLVYEYFEAPFETPVADYDAIEPVAFGVATDLASLPPHRPDHFGFRFHGVLALESGGPYRFATTSDDGSRLWIDGELVVANDGFHGMDEVAEERTLSAGNHQIVVTMFERDGGEGLLATLAPSGEEPVPLGEDRLFHRVVRLDPAAAAFPVDPVLVAEGRRWFRELRCAACHVLVVAGEQAPLASAPAAPLLDLDPRAPHGCLGEEPGPGVPRFELDERARAALREALEEPERLLASPPAADRVRIAMTRLSCFACHRRDGLGGPPPERRGYFRSVGDLDLGDQGRFPPLLEGVGRKLRGETLRRVLLEGDPVRPYLRTRMPRFDPELVAPLADAFIALDLRAGDDLEPAFDAAALDAGRRLAGSEGGLGCVQCHRFGDYPPIGVPAVDLTVMYARLRPGWFADLLRNPVALGMNSRMPQLWTDGRSPVQDLYGGDVEQQITALRAYLSLGRSAPVPPGVAPSDAEYELIPVDEPITCGVFLRGASPRTLVVGNPEGIHYAFDMQNSRLVRAWRGRFFNARGTWFGRAGQLEDAPSDDRLDLPAGMPLARLSSGDEAWPDLIGAEAGFRRLGQRYDEERRPVFRYAFGDIEVEEHLIPELRPGGAVLVRRLLLESRTAPADLWFRPSDGSPPRRVRWEALLPAGKGEERWRARLEEVLAW